MDLSRENDGLTRETGAFMGFISGKWWFSLEEMVISWDITPMFDS